jgi:ribonuclease Z
MISVLEYDEFHIFAVPMKHLIPTIGLRIEFLKSKKVLAYSCDTEPCPQVIRLAQSANILIHEATGLSAGHSSAEQAGEAATRAKVSELYLIHYPAGKVSASELLSEARRKFKGPVRVAEDFGSLNMD